MSSQWFYRKGTARFGPVSGAEIKKLAAAGELVETDLVRGVGMTEWVPAARIKGLFPGAVPPTTAPKAPKAKPEPKPAVSKPVRQAAAPPADIKAAAPAVDPNDPFAAFAFAPTSDSVPDPFGGFPGASLDQLVALEKQSAAVYKEPTVSEPSIETKRKAEPDEPATLGAGGKFTILVAPFAVLAVLAFACAFIHNIIFAYMMGFPKVIAILFSSSMSVGLAKMTGLFAGNCLLKAEIKNEVAALGYGGLLGLFSSYVCMAGFTWMLITFNPYKGHFDDAHFDDAPGEAKEVWVAPEEERPVLNLFQEDKDSLEALDEFLEKSKEQDRIQQRRDAGFLGTIAGMNISLPTAFLPYWTFFTFSQIWWYWLLHCGLMFCGMAHSTWTANLGHDPTRGGF